jgi:hypothetical protein
MKIDPQQQDGCHSLCPSAVTIKQLTSGKTPQTG